MRLLAALTLAVGLTAARADDAPTTKTINARMQAFVDSGELSGAVTAVGRKDGLLHLAGVGKRDLEKGDRMRGSAVFRIASMTKPITAVGVMILADRGKLSPADPVSKHLPEFADLKLADGKTPARPVTLADLLTHTSGLNQYPAEMKDVYTKRNFTLAETTKAVAGRPLLFEPGTKWAYCNPGIDTLGRVIEVVSGQKYEDFLKANVFDPLGMADTAFYPGAELQARTATVYGKKDGKLVPSSGLIIDLAKEAKHPIPAGGLYSTAADLAQFYRMMLNGGELGGKRILSAAAVADMTRDHLPNVPGRVGFTEGGGFGYGWAVVREPKGVTEKLSAGSYGHGGAFGTQGWLDPKQDLFVILLIARTGLSNSDASPMRQAIQEEAVKLIKE